MARWRRRKDPGVPQWVVDAWVAGEDWESVDAWLDDLYLRDFDRWEAAFTELVSVPSYVRRSG